MIMPNISQTRSSPLSMESIKSISETVTVPRYDRNILRHGIVHIGVGNFHRAHQAWYLQQLMQHGKALNWAIIGAGVRTFDNQMRKRLLAQDCLTTLLELQPDRTVAEVCGSMIDYLPVEENNRALISKMTDPATRIVSLTVTEGGYFLCSSDGRFDRQHPEITFDASHPDQPRTAFGAIIAALANRRMTGCGPFTIQSCDNLRGNGDVTRKTVISLARLIEPDLADWISANCSFPNSMVDCIVPATGDRERSLALSFGIEDAVPVTHENYRQWVIEDKFCAGRPDWDKVGATFTDRVEDYEAMKIRILNAGHQVLANVGELLSLRTIAHCINDPKIRAMFKKVQREEIVPFVAPVPEITSDGYASLIVSRFSNPAIQDTTRRVACDGSIRHPGFILPILREGLATNSPIQGISLVEAIWARMCAGQREDGSVIEPNDINWNLLNETALSARTRPQAWLEQHQIYGALGKELRFSETFTTWLNLIWSQGTEAALEKYIA